MYYSSQWSKIRSKSCSGRSGTGWQYGVPKWYKNVKRLGTPAPNLKTWLQARFETFVRFWRVIVGMFYLICDSMQRTCSLLRNSWPGNALTDIAAISRCFVLLLRTFNAVLLHCCMLNRFTLRRSRFMFMCIGEFLLQYIWTQKQSN